MPRQTRIKKGSIDFNSVLSPGYLLDLNDKLITGYRWNKYQPTLNQNSLSITQFQLPSAVHVTNSTILLYMFVNGVKVEPDYLSLDPQETTLVNYNDQDYQIISTDLVDIWYVPGSSVNGQQQETDLVMPQAAGSDGHVQINDGSDQITFAPIRWLNNALVPDQDLSYDLGTPTKRWNDLYLNNSTIHLGSTPISVDQNGNLLVDAQEVALAADVAPATLLQDQNFVNSLTGAQGPQGIQGAQGPVGPQGTTGTTGPQGLQGPQGPAGPQGTQGIQGLTGPQGSVGADGPQGPQGLQGDQGLQGTQGIQGSAGAQGPAGVSITFKGQVSADPSGSGLVTLISASTFTPSGGDAVLSQTDDSLFVFDGSGWVDGGSIQGPQGIQGIQGTQGVAGPQGSIGPAGAAGAVGPQGPIGQTGPQGPQGLVGSQGTQGLQGVQGASGASISTLAINNTTVAATLTDSTAITGTVSMNLNSLSDVDITTSGYTLSDGYVLTYDTGNSHWRPEPVTSTASNIALNDLSNVTASSPGLNDGLFYNTVNNAWEARPFNKSTDNYLLVSSTTNTLSITKQNVLDDRKVVYIFKNSASSLTINLPDLATLNPNDQIRLFYINPNITTTLNASANTVVIRKVDGTYITNGTTTHTNSLSGIVVLTCVQSSGTKSWLIDYQQGENISSLSDLSDVSFTTPDTGSNLVYNNTSWVEDKVVNIPHSTSSGGQFPIVDIRNVSIEYYSRVDITTAAGTRLGVIVPDPSQATLGRILEVNLNTAGGNQLTNIYTWRSNFNNTNDFVNDGNLSSVYYRSAGYTNLKFKVVQVGANYRWENIHRAPISQPEYSEIGLLDTSVSTTDTGTDGNINFKTNNVSRWDINSSGHIIPAANATYDLGEASSKVRHLYLSDNSIKFESGDLGVNGNGNLSFTPTGQASTSLLAQQNNLLTIQGDSTSGAIKLNCENNSHGVTVQGPPHSANATYTLTLPETIGAADQVMKVDGSGNLGWVTPSSGGSGASPEAMIAINTSTLNMAPTTWSPNYAFSNMRGASYSARNTWFSSNNTILTKTIQNTTLPKAHYTYPTTSFPAGKYRFIWRLTLTKPSSGTYSVNENIVDGLLNYSHGPSGQISANHNLIYKKLRHFYEITASNIEIEVEFIFEMASASMLKLWKDYAGSSENWRHWLAQEFTLLEEYQEMQKLSNYSFDSSLTL